MLSIEVGTLSGSASTYECSKDDKLLDVKVRVATDASRPSSKIKLLSGTELLKNDARLAPLALDGSVKLQMVFDNERVAAGTVENFSSTGRTWEVAIEELLGKLAVDGVEQGQVLWIDVHNKYNMPADCVVCAYFSREIVGRGPLHISARGHAGTSWEELYTWADGISEGKEVISISGASCIPGHSGLSSTDSKYICIFHYAGEVVPAMKVEHVSSAGGSWWGAATGLLMALQDRGVQRGQLLGIDAHNTHPDGDAVFTAHFSHSLQGDGRLALTCDCTANEVMGWTTLHDRASDASTGRELVSLTGSSNCNGRTVMFAFWHVPVDPLEFCIVETAPGTWQAAAEALSVRLAELQVARDQIVTIDAHNKGFDQPCVLSAHYHAATSSPGGSQLRLAWKLREQSGCTWDYLCGWAHSVAEGTDVLSITGASGTLACGARGLSMMVFFNSSGDEQRAESPARDLAPVEFVHSSGGSWNGSADALLRALVQAKVERDQIINISACNRNPDDNAEFQCHFCRSRVGGGLGGGRRGQVVFKSFNVTASFNAMHHQIGVLGSGKDIISITGCSNCSGRTVLYVFFWKDESDV